MTGEVISPGKNVAMLSNRLLNIYVFIYRSVILFALVGEACSPLPQWLIQRFITDQSIENYD